MPGILYVVATPIGNLEDVTLRALRTLREVSVIAAEDTRRTARLLQHYSISTRTTSLHEHNERSKTPSLVARMAAGESIALVSDAGTPVVSDPGMHLVAAAHAAGIRVVPIPGASAAVAALSSSGLAEHEFLFLGFPPNRTAARRRWLEKVADERRVLIIYEAPHRIQATLEDMLAVLGDRTVALGRELTKAHEELVVRPISTILQLPFQQRGEFTLVISGNRPNAVAAKAIPSAQSLSLEFGQLTSTGGASRRQGLKTLALKYDMSAREVFALLEAAKISGE
ncbi:MAG: 16S rRNA (cytidine(1402)-2'-O)-methyltransferase [Acidobacteriota bacterium]